MTGWEKGRSEDADWLRRWSWWQYELWWGRADDDKSRNDECDVKAKMTIWWEDNGRSEDADRLRRWSWWQYELWWGRAEDGKSRNDECDVKVKMTIWWEDNDELTREDDDDDDGRSYSQSLSWLSGQNNQHIFLPDSTLTSSPQLGRQYYTIRHVHS
jgi:hypothetical protein